MKRKIMQCMLFGIIAVAASQTMAAGESQCSDVKIDLRTSNNIYYVSFSAVCEGQRKFDGVVKKEITAKVPSTSSITIDYGVVKNNRVIGASDVEWEARPPKNIPHSLLITCKDAAKKGDAPVCSYK